MIQPQLLQKSELWTTNLEISKDLVFFFPFLPMKYINIKAERTIRSCAFPFTLSSRWCLYLDLSHRRKAGQVPEGAMVLEDTGSRSSCIRPFCDCLLSDALFPVVECVVFVVFTCCWTCFYFELSASWLKWEAEWVGQIVTCRMLLVGSRYYTFYTRSAFFLDP